MSHFCGACGQYDGPLSHVCGPTLPESGVVVSRTDLEAVLSEDTAWGENDDVADAAWERLRAVLHQEGNQ